MWLLDPRNGPDGDVPGVPVRAWAIASIPRSASTLLGRLAGSTGAVGEAKEWLNPMQMRDFERRLAPDRGTRLRHAPLVGPLQGLAGSGRWDRARLAAYLARIQGVRTGPSGVFGLKIHGHHFDRWEADLEAVLPPITWVVITREDRVAQAVSWYRALQTGRWAATQRAWLPPVYDRARIAALEARIAAMEARWDAVFAARGVAPLRLTTEALVADPAGTVRAVLAHVGVPDRPIAAVPTHPQADAISAGWIARFRAPA
jgi:LPS sulfotransferase NodH